MRRVVLECPQPSFIGCWNLDDPRLCQAIIEHFELHPARHTSGRSTYGVDLSVKNSVDYTVYPKEINLPSHAILDEYMQRLHDCYRDYLLQWPFLDKVIGNIDIGEFNIQKYNPGGHFGRVHSERTALDNAHRLLAWMTYLNDVEDGGQTHFEHYGIDIKPEQGKTLIWPAEWTHAHAGKVVNSGVKYIITGWMHFPAK
jgi:hypothetical protein